MTKRVDSRLLAQFLYYAEQYKVGCDKDGSALSVLSQICDSFEAILAGSHPDTALEIERPSGPQKKPHNFYLALFIQEHKYDNGEKWEVVMRLANEWLTDRGLPQLSLPGLKRIHRENYTTAKSQSLLIDLLGVLLQYDATVGLPTEVREEVELTIEMMRRSNPSD